MLRALRLVSIIMLLLVVGAQTAGTTTIDGTPITYCLDCGQVTAP